MRHTFCVSHWFGGRAVVRSCIYRGCTSIRPGVVFLCESLLFLPLRHGTGFNPMSLRRSLKICVFRQFKINLAGAREGACTAGVCRSCAHASTAATRAHAVPAPGATWPRQHLHGMPFRDFLGRRAENIHCHRTPPCGTPLPPSGHLAAPCLLHCRTAWRQHALGGSQMMHDRMPIN
jgi:hypothetical protein